MVGGWFSLLKRGCGVGGCLTKIKHWSKDLKGARYVGISDPGRGNGEFRGFKVGVLTGFQEAAKRLVCLGQGEQGAGIRR